MNQSQNYSIKPQGLVHGGECSYSLETETGRILYKGQVTAGFWPLKRTEKVNDTIQVDPNVLRSSGARTVGDSMTLGDATFLVTKADPGRSEVAITIRGQDLTGVGVLDTSGDFILVRQLTFKGKVGPFNLVVEADEVPIGCIHKRPSELHRALEALQHHGVV